ncbi:MAG: IS1595 family transposase [Rhodospirillales bacterium]|nr:IS1595 family transposase [Rhodospirillales bacterium]
MAKRAPGKAYRKGITLLQLTRKFPDDASAEAWFRKLWWPDGPVCPRCGTTNVQEGIKHPTMTHRCRECPKRPMFSMKTGTLMEGSKLGFQTWAFAVYLVTTNLKGVSSMKLHRDLGVSQKTAWHLAHRIRESWKNDAHPPFIGPVEADETYVGGKRKNMPKSKRQGLKGRGAVGKTAVAGVKDRQTRRVTAEVVQHTDGATLVGFVHQHTMPGGTVFTDEAHAYKGLKHFYHHEAVNHGVGEYVRGQASTNGMESFWSMLKRGYQGTFHHMSEKHLDRYVTEFSGRHNDREADTIDQMAGIAKGMVGKRLKYRDLTA